MRITIQKQRIPTQLPQMKCVINADTCRNFAAITNQILKIYSLYL